MRFFCHFQTPRCDQTFYGSAVAVSPSFRSQNRLPLLFLHFLSIFDMQELIVWGLEHKQLFFRALGIAAKPEWRRRRSSIGTTLTLTFQVSSVCLKTYFFFLPCFHIIQYLHEEGNMEGALLCAVNKKEGPLGITFFPQSSLPISEIHKTRPFILHVFQTYQTTGNLPRRAKRAINQVPN